MERANYFKTIYMLIYNTMYRRDDAILSYILVFSGRFNFWSSVVKIGCDLFPVYALAK
jgi:hypothetical protein